MAWVLVYNPSSGSVAVDGNGRSVDPYEFTYADLTLPLVADAIARGGLVNVPITFDPALDGTIDPEARAAAAEVIARNGGAYVPPGGPALPPPPGLGVGATAAVDRGGLATNLSAGVLALLSPRLAVPPGCAAVLQFGAWFKTLASGTGLPLLAVMETTSGTAEEVCSAFPDGNRTYSAGGVFLPLGPYLQGSFDVDPSSGWRYFRLAATVFVESGSGLTMQVARSDDGFAAGRHDRSPFMRSVAP